jgi:transcriptional regulator
MGTTSPLDSPQLLPGTLYMLILRTLARGPLHGYAIARRIKDASEEGLQIEDGSLYPALNRMLVKGWLAAEWGISENNRKARFYSLTKDGRKQLESEAREFDRLIKAIQLVMGNRVITASVAQSR